MRPLRALLLLLPLLLLSAWAASAQSKDPFSARGPKLVTLGSASSAQLDLKAGYVLVGAQDAQNILRTSGDSETDNVLGLIGQPGAALHWFGILRYEDTGYIRDDEADRLDANNLLGQIRDNTERANVYRRQHGLSAVDVVGWFQPPSYDRTRHTLSWSIIGSDRGTSRRVINYTTIQLGRRGILTCTIVGAPADGAALEQQLDAVRAAIHFPRGVDYLSFRPGDPISQTTLNTLITGGTAAAVVYGAAKLGLFAGLGKMLIPLLLAAKKLVFVMIAGFMGTFRKLAAKFGIKTKRGGAGKSGSPDA